MKQSKKGGFLPMLLGKLAASSLGITLTGWRVITAGERVITAGQNS